METPEQFRGNEKPDVTDEENELKRLIEAAENAGRVGVYDPAEIEGKK